MTYKDDSSRMGLTEYALECYLLHVPFSLCFWMLLFFKFLFKPTSLLSQVTLFWFALLASPLLSSLSIPSYVTSVLFPLLVPTHCDVCGFHGGCSLPPSPGD